MRATNNRQHDRRRYGDRRHPGLSRRAFLGLGAAGIASLLAPLAGSSAAHGAPATEPPPPLKPPRLEPGDTVGLINPPSISPRPGDVEAISQRLASLDLKVRPARHTLEPEASAEQRAADINELFGDPTVKALLPLRGGWGSARVLPHIDYELVRRHPKVVMGYSDVVALLLALRARTGLVTFHGPMGVSAWEPFTVECARQVLFQGREALLCNPAADFRTAEGIRTLSPGRARGTLAGGNLTVMSSMIGSPYLAYEDAILFVEEVQEAIPEVDRMLTQLEQVGMLDRARGFVFGHCTGCMQSGLDPTLTLQRVLEERIRPLGIPAWSGAAFGHVERQFVVPIGVAAEIDAGRGTIHLLEPAVA
jgi:muramoyltetrapeptide carboxypeptidase